MVEEEATESPASKDASEFARATPKALHTSVPVRSSGRFMEYVRQLRDGETPTPSSSAELGSVVRGLEERIRGIEESLGRLSASVISLRSSPGQEVSRRVQEQVAPIQEEIGEVRSELLPRLESAQDALRTHEAFLKETGDVLVSALKVGGTMESLQGQVEAVEKRLSSVESRMGESRSWALNLVLAVAAVVGVLVGCAGLVFGLYQNFMR